MAHCWPVLPADQNLKTQNAFLLIGRDVNEASTIEAEARTLEAEARTLEAKAEAKVKADRVRKIVAFGIKELR